MRIAKHGPLLLSTRSGNTDEPGRALSPRTREVQFHCDYLQLGLVGARLGRRVSEQAC